MSASPSSDNPWRPFRRQSTGRCDSITDRNITKSSLPQKDIDNVQDQKRNIERRLFPWNHKTFTTEPNMQRTHYSLDDNGNANMSYNIMCPGIRHVITCDRQTQTESYPEISTRCDMCLRRPSNRIGASKSCDNFTRQCRLGPQESKSYEIYSVTNKGNDMFVNCVDIANNEAPVQVFRSKKSVISPIPKAISTDAKDYYVKHNSIETPNKALPESRIDKTENERTIDETRDEDMSQDDKASTFQATSDVYIPAFEAEAEHDTIDICDGAESQDGYRNEWSPFHIRDDNRNFYDYREADDISLASERSCYSTQSGDEEKDYDVIDWSQFTDEYQQEVTKRQKKTDRYGTPLSTPILDLSALDGYHTAPNSPKTVNSDKQLATNCLNSTAVIDALSEYNISNIEPVKTDTKDKAMASNQNNANVVQGNHVGQSLCCKCGNVADAGYHTEKDQNANWQNIQPQPVKPIQTPMSDWRMLQLELPPTISVNSIHYEADPETGRAKIIGRGSFGEVYKARFSDPMFYHLPIVIKEFDEEFTNSKEILEEAKRLLYLQDTGYVPICYGLLRFGTPNEPKYGIVQEYVGTGLTLEQMLWDRYELPLEYWFRIVIQCCEGLARFHDKGILLNDIKTNNILIEFAEHSVRIRYIDFGLATDMRGKRYKNTKSLEDFVYLAPEVRIYGKVTNIASDVFSLGYILEQIYTYTGMHELTVIARLCMDNVPEKRLPVRSAANLIKDHMYKMGYDPLITWGL